MQLLKLFVKYIKGNIKYFVAGFLMIIALNYIRSLIPLFISKVFEILGNGENVSTLPSFINHIFDGKSATVQLTICAISIVVVAIIRDTINLGTDLSIACASEGVGYNMQTDFYNHVQNLPYSYLNHAETGDLIQRSIQDVSRVKMFVGSQLSVMVTNIAQIAIYSTQMLFINVEFSLYILSLIPVLFIFTLLYFRKQNKLWEDMENNEGLLMNVIQENYTGIRVVKAFANEEYEINKFNQVMDKFMESWDKPNRRMSTFWMSNDLVSYFMLLLTFVLGLVFIFNNKLLFSELIALFLFVQSIMWPAKNLGRLIANFGRVNISAKRILEIVTLKTEYDDDNKSTLKPKIEGDIVFEDVSFKFEDATYNTIKDINLHIQKGETIALIGKTGSGKSTLVALLNRMLDPSSGHIYVDGVDISQIDKQYLRKNVGIVLQEPFLFSRSIADNIGITANKIDLKLIKSVANIASVDSDIEAFKDGYNTMVGERGVTLSGGQKQRVSIARTILQNKPILIFDDSLSAVDTETDIKIRKALKNRESSSTTIIITHRVQTAKDADKIIVLEDGMIKDIGTHDELIKKDGLYKTINDIQTYFKSDGGEL
ncbi:MAG: ABC transporter ATP-binding protein [Bacilli bacterium]|nr:ABC transporter ATP-binding protein [Bacilli bacterium]